MAGQPTKVSAALANKIAGLISRGVRMADAAEQSGIDRSSFFNWMEWGRQGKAPYAAFQATITAAVRKGKRPKQAG